jgi:uncharacterized protein YecT (DUF1311 family)
VVKSRPIYVNEGIHGVYVWTCFPRETVDNAEPLEVSMWYDIRLQSPEMLRRAMHMIGTAGPVGVEPKAPVISESLTLLPCPAKPKTTLDFEGCAEHKIVRSDKAINKRVGTIFSLLRSHRSAAAVSHFVRGERFWLAARRAVCKSRADVYEGGSAAPLTFAGCEVKENAAHLRDLTAFEHVLRR